jgi:hypothetical protein
MGGGPVKPRHRADRPTPRHARRARVGRGSGAGGRTRLIGRLAVVPAAAVASVSLFGSGALAAPAYTAHWTLDEIGSGTAADVTGNGNDGANYNVVGDGSGYIFDGVDSRVIVPNAPSLNSGPGDFSWGVTLSMTSPPMPQGETYDILRKGLAGGKGGDYKLEIMNSGGKAKARCVFNSVLANGKRANSAIQGSSSLADGRQHTITCTKTSNAITIYVDALAARTKTISGGLGTVSNTADLALGAKAEETAKSGFDWFAGEMYDAWVGTGS